MHPFKESKRKSNTVIEFGRPVSVKTLHTLWIIRISFFSVSLFPPPLPAKYTQMVSFMSIPSPVFCADSHMLFHFRRPSARRRCDTLRITGDIVYDISEVRCQPACLVSLHWNGAVINLCVNSQVGIVGKYGTRYGASLRKIIKKMEVSQHSKYFCNFCGKVCSILNLNWLNYFHLYLVLKELSCIIFSCMENPYHVLVFCLIVCHQTNCCWYLGVQGMRKNPSRRCLRAQVRDKATVS